jgi:exopolysaccharide biosynthesis polyprenyl glycosylphosphotransferase
MPPTSANTPSIAMSQASPVILDHLSGLQPAALDGCDTQSFSGPLSMAKLRSSAYKSHKWVYLAAIGDLAMVALAMLFAFWTRFVTLESVGRFTAADLETYAGHLVLGSLSLIALFAWRGIYRREALLHSSTVLRKIAKSVIFWTFGFLLFALVFQTQPPISRIYMALAGAWSLVLLSVWRHFFNKILRQPKILATLQKRTLIVGTPEEVTELMSRFEKSHETSSKITGWVTTTADLDNGASAAGIPRLGEVSQLSILLEKQPFETLILTDLSGPRERPVEIASICEREMITFKIIPSCFRIFVSGLQLETVANTPIVGVSRLPLDSSANVLIKRFFDICGGLFGLIITAPIVATFALIVWLESRGSVIYRQRRTGADGRNFTIFKIRSMKLDAETKGGAQWCKQDDPRRLRVGAFMRKWNIDELPQFWNVVKGEMSLVGPRPERPELIAQFKHTKSPTTTPATTPYPA